MYERLFRPVFICASVLVCCVFLYMQKCKCLIRSIVGAWSDVTSYVSSDSSDKILATGLSLQSGDAYRLSVKFCVYRACSLPIFSSGIYVISGPPIAGSSAVALSNNNGSSEVREFTVFTVHMRVFIL